MATPRISTVLAARSAWCGLGVLVLVAAGITANAQGDLPAVLQRISDRVER